MRPVLTLGRRAIDFVLLLLAVYMLAVVPLGRHTGLEHLRAILRTKAARDAGLELRQAAQRLGRRLVGDDGAGAPRTKPQATVSPHRPPGNVLVTEAAFERLDASVSEP
jgi:hypothetical protein